jgi:hypothetical protein
VWKRELILALMKANCHERRSLDFVSLGGSSQSILDSAFGVEPRRFAEWAPTLAGIASGVAGSPSPRAPSKRERTGWVIEH